MHVRMRKNSIYARKYKIFVPEMEERGDYEFHNIRKKNIVQTN